MSCVQLIILYCMWVHLAVSGCLLLCAVVLCGWNVDVVVASELVQFGDGRNCDSRGYGQSRDIDNVGLE